MTRRLPFSRPVGTQARPTSRVRASAGRPDSSVSWRVGAASVAAVLLVGLLFALWPDLDLILAREFARPSGGFVGDTGPGRLLRRIFQTLPFLLLGGLAACYALRRLGSLAVWAPNKAGLLMLAASLALGPGLLVNTLLKDHSHRPRPVQVTQFGGPFAFRPFYRFDGDCQRNCSFVSGEGSLSTWTLAPALLAPPPYRIVAVTAALVLATATSLLRMAFGGHFASDSLLAALFTWLVILGCWRWAARLAGDPPGFDRTPSATQPSGPDP